MLVPGLRFDVDHEAIPWRSTRVPGIAWLPLHLAAEHGGHAAAEDDAPGDSTALIRMDPGCGYPRHRHVGVEEVLVLAGGYEDEFGRYGTGSYVRYPPGSAHSPVALGQVSAPPGPENPACVLFAVARGGVDLDVAGRADPGQAAEGG